jgi:hypothetical protein
VPDETRYDFLSVYREFEERFRVWKADHTTAKEWFAWGVYWRTAAALAGVLSLVAVRAALDDAPLIKADQDRALMRDASMAHLDRDLDALCARVATVMPRRTTAAEPPSFALNPFAVAVPETCSSGESNRP